MDAAAPYAADEQMRVEALRAAVACYAGPDAALVMALADVFLAWLLGEPVDKAALNAIFEGSD
jgi:hypothetical protein